MLSTRVDLFPEQYTSKLQSLQVSYHGIIHFRVIKIVYYHNIISNQVISYGIPGSIVYFSTWHFVTHDVRYIYWVVSFARPTPGPLEVAGTALAVDMPFVCFYKYCFGNGTGPSIQITLFLATNYFRLEWHYVCGDKSLDSSRTKTLEWAHDMDVQTGPRTTSTE